jgi:hypothetical protein
MYHSLNLGTLRSRREAMPQVRHPLAILEFLASARAGTDVASHARRTDITGLSGIGRKRNSRNQHERRHQSRAQARRLMRTEARAFSIGAKFVTPA